MITDLMTVHDAFLARFEGHVLRGSTVPVRFFNAQPKLKEAPVYPSLIVTVFIPKPGNFVWTSETEILNNTTKTVTSIPPPKDVHLKYQVDARANRFDDINALYLWLFNAIKEAQGSKFLEVGDDTLTCAITDMREVPDIDMGVFQWSFTYDIRIPLFGVTWTVRKMIEDSWTVNVNGVAPNEPFT